LAHALGGLTGAGKCEFEWPLEAGGVQRFIGGGIDLLALHSMLIRSYYPIKH